MSSVTSTQPVLSYMCYSRSQQDKDEVSCYKEHSLLFFFTPAGLLLFDEAWNHMWMIDHQKVFFWLIFKATSAPSVCAINNSQQWSRLKRGTHHFLYSRFYIYLFLFLFFFTWDGLFLFCFHLSDFFISFMFLYEAAVALSVKKKKKKKKKKKMRLLHDEGFFFFFPPSERSVHHRQQMFRRTATVTTTIIQSDGCQIININSKAGHN